MDVAVTGKMSSFRAHNNNHGFVQPSYKFIKDAFPTRKSRSSSLLFGHSKDFKNVETFNLNPGFRLSRSAGKIFVSIQPTEPVSQPKPEARKLTVAEMESLISNLREQIDLLSTYLEEERLRHGGTKKRAALELVQMEKKLSEKYEQEVVNLNECFNEERNILEGRLEERLKRADKERDERLEKMQTEYRMLQASFKIYRSTLQDEMQDEMKIKRAEFEWEKKRSIENALDDCKRKMEEDFSREREDMRKEFLKNMNDMMQQHQVELEKMSEKSKSEDEIRMLVKRSGQLDDALEEIEQRKTDLQEMKEQKEGIASDLNETKRKLATLELQFDDKVREVEDKHRSIIDNLRLEKADVTRRLVHGCEDLQVEKMARERAEQQRKEAAIDMLQKYVKSVHVQTDGMDDESKWNELSTSVGRKSQDLTKLVGEITGVLASYDNAHLTPALVEFLSFLKKWPQKRQRKGRLVSHSSMFLTDPKLESTREEIRSRSLRKFSKSDDSSRRLLNEDHVTRAIVVDEATGNTEEEVTATLDLKLDDVASLWDSMALKNSIVDLAMRETETHWVSPSVKSRAVDAISGHVARLWDGDIMQRKVDDALLGEMNSGMNAMKRKCAETVFSESMWIWEDELLKRDIGEVLPSEMKKLFKNDQLERDIFNIVSNDPKLSCCSDSAKQAVSDVIFNHVQRLWESVETKAEVADVTARGVKQRLEEGSAREQILNAVSDDAVTKLENEVFQSASVEAITRDATVHIVGDDVKRKVSKIVADKVSELWKSEEFKRQTSDAIAQDMVLEGDVLSVGSLNFQIDPSLRTVSREVLTPNWTRDHSDSVQLGVTQPRVSSANDSGVFGSDYTTQQQSERNAAASSGGGQVSKAKPFKKSPGGARKQKAKSHKSSSPRDEIPPDHGAYFNSKLRFLSQPTEQAAGRWRGKFSVTGSGRLPIIFDVEQFKTLTCTTPDSSGIAKKAILYDSQAKRKSAARKDKSDTSMNIHLLNPGRPPSAASN